MIRLTRFREPRVDTQEVGSQRLCYGGSRIATRLTAVGSNARPSQRVGFTGRRNGCLGSQEPDEHSRKAIGWIICMAACLERITSRVTFGRALHSWRHGGWATDNLPFSSQGRTRGNRPFWEAKGLRNQWTTSSAQGCYVSGEIS